MNEVKIIVDKKITTYTAPADWNECTKEDLINISKTVRAGYSVIQSEIYLALKLFKIPIRLFSKLSAEDKFAIVSLCKFVENERILDKNLIPSFRFIFQKYFGPSDEYDNIEGLEFAYTELCYTRYIETKQLQYLEDLCAILYRPRKYFNVKNDIRKDFFVRESNNRSKKFKSLPHHLKFSIFLNYEAWRNWLISEHPNIFPKIQIQEDSEDEPTSGNNTSLWVKAYRMIAESGVFGNYDQVCKQPLLVLFAQLEDKILEAKEDRSKYKQ